MVSLLAVLRSPEYSTSSRENRNPGNSSSRKLQDIHFRYLETEAQIPRTWETKKIVAIHFSHEFGKIEILHAPGALNQAMTFSYLTV